MEVWGTPFLSGDTKGWTARLLRKGGSALGCVVSNAVLGVLPIWC